MSSAPTSIPKDCGANVSKILISCISCSRFFYKIISFLQAHHTKNQKKLLHNILFTPKISFISKKNVSLQRKKEKR